MAADIRFGVDLVTFFHPDFFGVPDAAGVVALAAADPLGFWTGMLDAVADAGVKGIECTFAPFDLAGAEAAFGGTEAFAAALEQRGLVLASGFFASVSRHRDLGDPALCDALVAEAAAHAAALARLGGKVMVMGLPMRRSRDAEPAFVVDLGYMSGLADLCNRIGVACARHGVALALHTESHSVFSTARDVDLLLLLTDPVYVGFCPDSAHLLGSGADPVAVLSRHCDRLVFAHWKDATGPMPADMPIDEAIHDRHKPYFCALGRGRVDWPAWARLHRDVGYSGWVILEVDASPDPVTTIAESREFVETALLPILS